MKFIDYITQTALTNGSPLCAGFDPVLEQLPTYFLDLGAKKSTTEESTYASLSSFYRFAIETIASSVACVKPNIAFFEQYGLGGLRALSDLLATAREHKLPTILDCKRGDIGSTAAAYANAYFQGADFSSDAITVNPFLGFDTVEVFLKSAVENNRGIFVLVKTSNPGSKDLQDQVCDGGNTISEQVAQWLEKNQKALAGDLYPHLSGVGAVVGATHPDHLKQLRMSMPHALLLVPGYGAQGGKAEDLAAAFIRRNTGAVVNASRGLMNAWSDKSIPLEALKNELLQTVGTLNTPLIFPDPGST